MAKESMEWVSALMQGAFTDPEALRIALTHLAQAAMEEGIARKLSAGRHERPGR